MVDGVIPRPGRGLAWDGCFNVRDLGGLPAAEGRRTRRGASVRSDILDTIQTPTIDDLGELSVRTRAEVWIAAGRKGEVRALEQVTTYPVTYLHPGDAAKFARDPSPGSPSAADRCNGQPGAPAATTSTAPRSLF